jgi:[CysO sulfur-carrier protein]-S-L-cysteine hydrolase
LDDWFSYSRIVLQIILSSQHKQILSKEAINKQPNESCALLFGKKVNDKIIITEIYLAENIEKSPINFTISNEQLIQGYKIAEDKGLEVIGIFHSHPNSEPYPSETDKKFMQINPVIWIIFSLVTNEFKAYLYELEVIPVAIVT